MSQLGSNEMPRQDAEALEELEKETLEKSPSRRTCTPNPLRPFFRHSLSPVSIGDSSHSLQKGSFNLRRVDD